MSQNVSGECGTAIVVTNQNDEVITKEVLIIISEDGNIVNAFLDDPAGASPQEGDTIYHPSEGDLITIKVVVVYNRFFHEGTLYYQPVGAYFNYRKNDSSCDVSYIQIVYTCEGNQLSYPGFEDLHLPLYTHEIVVSQSNPRPSYLYSTTNSYNTNRVIDITAGGSFVGNYITFTTTINGHTEYYTTVI